MPNDERSVATKVEVKFVDDNQKKLIHKKKLLQAEVLMREDDGVRTHDP